MIDGLTTEILFIYIDRIVLTNHVFQTFPKTFDGSNIVLIFFSFLYKSKSLLNFRRVDILRPAT